MNIRLSSAALLCLTLATSAMAQDVAIPDRDQRRGMSYEEYSQLRENMRMRMEKMHNSGSPKNVENEPHENAQAAQQNPESTYGKGYRTRTQENISAPERPERAERPERPERVEKISRPERPERPGR